MSWSPEDDLDEYGRTPREARNAGRCQCAGASEWPGYCPGPASCPLCGQSSWGDDEAQALEESGDKDLPLIRHWIEPYTEDKT